MKTIKTVVNLIFILSLPLTVLPIMAWSAYECVRKKEPFNLGKHWFWEAF